MEQIIIRDWQEVMKQVPIINSLGEMDQEEDRLEFQLQPKS